MRTITGNSEPSAPPIHRQCPCSSLSWPVPQRGLHRPFCSDVNNVSLLLDPKLPNREGSIPVCTEARWLENDSPAHCNNLPPKSQAHSGGGRQELGTPYSVPAAASLPPLHFQQEPCLTVVRKEGWELVTFILLFITI